MSEMMRSSGADGSDPGAFRGRGRTVRIWCVYLAVTAGVVCAIAHWGLVRVLISVVVLAMVAIVLVSSAWDGPGRPTASRIIQVTFATALVLAAAAGLIAVLGLAGVLIVLALTATTPALTSRIRSRRRVKGNPGVVRPEPAPPRDRTKHRDRAKRRDATPRDPAPASAEAPEIAPARELTSLHDVELCLLWRQSFLLLETATTPARRQAVVEQRQLYLDELNRRSPEGFAAWLASGARASGNPFPYVDDSRRRAG